MIFSILAFIHLFFFPRIFPSIYLDTWWRLHFKDASLYCILCSLQYFTNILILFSLTGLCIDVFLVPSFAQGLNLF